MIANDAPVLPEGRCGDFLPFHLCRAGRFRGRNRLHWGGSGGAERARGSPYRADNNV